MINKTFLHFFFGFLAFIAVSFAVLLIAGALEPQAPVDPGINVAHQ